MVTRSENLSESTFVSEHQTTSQTPEKGSCIRETYGGKDNVQHEA
jgi:hypothetical protein